jgi:hypothetical protein
MIIIIVTAVETSNLTRTGKCETRTAGKAYGNLSQGNCCHS